jgi:hypothetical protein
MTEPRDDAGSTDTPRNPGGRRRVVYSALLGGYETLASRPVSPTGDVDFLFFTDSPTADPGDGWKVIPVEARFPEDSVRSARRLKILGHPQLDNYDEALWLDNRVRLRVPPAEIFSLLGDNDLVFPNHSHRTTLREEFSEVIASGYDSPPRVREMYRLASSRGVINERPLWTGMFLRKLDANVQDCMQRWFDYVLLTSRRDQLSINAALAESSLRVSRIELDNVESSLHEWANVRSMGRDKSIQMWRSGRRSPGLAAADAFRARPNGRKSMRALTRMGIRVPTLPR